MKRNTMFKSLLALVLVLALGSGTMMARQTLAQGPIGITGAASTLSVNLGTGFTYQGRLNDASGPVDGTCDLTFKLYDEAGTGTPPTGGTLLGTVTKLSEEVSAGYFTVQLDFGDSAFTGDARWLEIAVDCGSGATTLSPRQELAAAPYALYATSAPWSGLNDVPAGFADNTDNTDDTVAWSEISGIVGTGANQVAAGDHDHDGVYAPATHDHWGETWSGTGTGLIITGTDGGAMLEGINSGAGEGVRGQSNSGYGVYGNSHSDIGVYGYSNGDYGVFGRSASSSGYGVCARGTGGDLQLYDGTIYANRLDSSDLVLHSNDYVDIHLDDDSNSTSQFRVLNDANTAIFTVTETGAVSWATQTGYVSVSAAAFGPKEDQYDFTNFGGQLRNNDGNSDRYYAPVQLPHGATVTKMTWYWSDTSIYGGTAALRRGTNTGSYLLMAEVQTSGSGGNGSSYDGSISYATIDNQNYTYYLRWSLADTDVKGYYVVIEYTCTGPH